MSSHPINPTSEPPAAHAPHPARSRYAPASIDHHVEAFDTPARRSEAVVLGMWVFLATEILFFGGLFGVYGVYRYIHHDAFRDGSRTLDVWLGTFNTFVLLTSSLTMALAVREAAADRPRGTSRFLIATIVLGTMFLGIKGFEYWHKFEHHLLPAGGLPFEWPGENPGGVKLFIGLYLGMTGLHALHMVIGIAMLGLFAWTAGRPGFWRDRGDTYDVLGLYWHFVDLVWIFLFPLLYLIDRT